MTMNFKKWVAVGVSAGLVAVGGISLAQDDIDELLKDLESDETAVEQTVVDEEVDEVADERIASADDEAADDEAVTEEAEESVGE